MNKNLTQFKSLITAVEKFGVDIPTETKKIINQFEKGTLSTDLSDVFSTDNNELFIVLPDGSIRRALIHIVDISSWRELWGYPKFHIYSCKKIKEMKDEGRGYRYKASGQENGEFYLIKKDKKFYQTLEICHYCLELYNVQFGISHTKKDFPLKEYIKNPLSNSNLPKVNLDICTIPNCYQKNWAEISKKRKEQEKDICFDCERNFSSLVCKEFLDTHHVDADKRNNIRENLKVLCIECHSEKYNHGHIKHSDRYKKWLKSQCFKIQNKKRD